MNPQDPFVINPTPLPPNPPPAPAPAPSFAMDSIAPPTPQHVSPAPFVPTKPSLPPVQPITNLAPKPRKRSKKPLVFAATLVLLLIGITVGAIVLGGSKKTSTKPTDTTTSTPQGPQPAQAIDVEQASNSITQDVSGHDNSKDFPTAELDDKTLGL